MVSKQQNTQPRITGILLLFIVLSTNLLTFYISTTFFTSCSSSFINELASESDRISDEQEESVDNKDSSESEKNVVEEEEEEDLPPEFLAFTGPQKLPFGFNPNFRSDHMFPPVGHPCTKFPNELKKYMTYEVNGSCPADEALGQQLLLKGCEPLPRRRCRPAANPNYVEPYPFPKSLWTTPHNSSVVWYAYRCKDYACLVNRRNNQKEFDDCKDCFDLSGREKNRWTGKGKSDEGSLDFTIDEVLATRKPGTIRIGLDIGGGVATFAIRMRDRNITILTTSMNLNGPFNNFIASRGVVPLYISISQRLPFFDNTLDMVHSMHVLSNWIPTKLLQFMLFDYYRILRPGGLFWLDHFFCVGEQLEDVYEPLIDSVGFKRLKWVVGKKLDHGPEKRELYLSALLEKPLKNSW
ncbi:unnamed protein product [Rhodiola kirilowii]